MIHYYEEDTNELYNLVKDPYESQNLADNNSELTESLYEELKNWLIEFGLKFTEKDIKFDTEKL
ncbi:hypothetical protein [uncultured Maribacter sp.]|uniref:hypothetical protein n=1 Tax=uncultured Maribacter sp. TaxID=431308 RepID=UPI0030ED4F99